MSKALSIVKRIRIAKKIRIARRIREKKLGINIAKKIRVAKKIHEKKEGIHSKTNHQQKPKDTPVYGERFRKDFTIELKCGGYAIIQYCDVSNINNVKARIGILQPNNPYLEFISLDNWKATYEGNNNITKSKLIQIYNNNHKAIQSKIIGPTN